MELNTALAKKKNSILKKWYDRVLDSYPEDSVGFLKKEKDPFANPVGHTLHKETAFLLDGILENQPLADLSDSIDAIVRIKAVQDFTAAQAVEFVFLLKHVIRDELAGEINSNRIFEELLALESRIDWLALLAFDGFMKRREKIYEIKANQVMNMSYKLLERSNALSLLEEANEDHCAGEAPDRNGGHAK